MSESKISATAPGSASQRFLAARGLYDIDWSHLEHAYGPADDTPAHLETLYRASRRSKSNESGREKGDADGDGDDKDGLFALHDLEGSIAHQGSRYSASQAAVPFLYAILGGCQGSDAVDDDDDDDDDDDVDNNDDDDCCCCERYRGDILGLLGRLAVGNPTEFVPRGGIDAAAWRAATAAKQDPCWPAKEEQRRVNWVAEAEATGDTAEIKRRRTRVMMMPDPEDEVLAAAVELGCYDAVRQGLSAVRSLLRTQMSAATQSEAVLLLALFTEPVEAEASERVLRELLRHDDKKTEVTVRGSALLALGLLRRQRDGSADDSTKAAAAEAQKLLEETHAAAKAKREANSSDKDAAFEQWCCAVALVLLLGTSGVGSAVLSDVVAPLKDFNGVFDAYQPSKQVREKTTEEEEEEEGGGEKEAKGQQEGDAREDHPRKIERSEDQRDNERREDEKNSERSEDKKEHERSEDRKEHERSEDRKERRWFAFAPDDLDRLCGALLVDVKGSEHPDVARAVIGALRQAEGLAAVQDLTETALSMVFGPGTERSNTMSIITIISNKQDKVLPPFAQLSPLQQDAVQALAEVSEVRWLFMDFQSTLKQWGLPNTQTELAAYVSGKEEE
ncbi:MAG: hypothetical protein STHCBS139747_002713 [Sporothrix thermara]